MGSALSFQTLVNFLRISIICKKSNGCNWVNGANPGSGRDRFPLATCIDCRSILVDILKLMSVKTGDLF